MAQPTEDRIRARAHQIWEEAGRPHGADKLHWELAARDVELEDLKALPGADTVGKAGLIARKHRDNPRDDADKMPR